MRQISTRLTKETSHESRSGVPRAFVRLHSDSGQRRDYPDIQQIVTIAEQELKKMNDERDGRLSVFGPQDSLSLSTSDANYEAVGNHLYRIQIHDDGKTSRGIAITTSLGVIMLLVIIMPHSNGQKIMLQ